MQTFARNSPFGGRFLFRFVFLSSDFRLFFPEKKRPKTKHPYLLYIYIYISVLYSHSPTVCSISSSGTTWFQTGARTRLRANKAEDQKTSFAISTCLIAPFVTCDTASLRNVCKNKYGESKTEKHGGGKNNVIPAEHTSSV